MNFEKETVLVVAAHPDDEILGCGGTLARHIAEGKEAAVLILAEGVTARGDQRDISKNSSELGRLAQSAHQAHQILGTHHLLLKDFPDNRMDSMDLLDVVKVIEECLIRFKPATVYTHHIGDLNVDHRVTHQAVITACRPTGIGASVRDLLFFEVQSSTDYQIPGSGNGFQPNWFTDISSSLKTKLKALSAYSSEMKPWPHSRSLEAVEHLAKWRGATLGIDAAEAFILGRHKDSAK